jgi:hypothetical protein
LEIARAAIRTMLDRARTVEWYGSCDPTLWQLLTRRFRNPVVLRYREIGPEALADLINVGEQALSVTEPLPASASVPKSN